MTKQGESKHFLRKSVGQYTKAEEYLQKALVIRKEIGDKKGEAADYGNLGTVFQSVGQYTYGKGCESVGQIPRLKNTFKKH